jgi:hypothetical protein
VPFYRQRAVRGTAHLRCEAKEGTKEGPGRGRRMGRQPADVGGLSAGACGDATRGGRGLQGAWTTCSLGSHALWHGTEWEARTPRPWGRHVAGACVGMPCWGAVSPIFISFTQV